MFGLPRSSGGGSVLNRGAMLSCGSGMYGTVVSV